MILLALLTTAVQTAWAFTPLAGDTWDNTTKTLTVNSNPGDGAYKENPDKEEIVHIIFNSGVTTIGDYAFWECTGLTDIAIPATVTSIGDFAFQGCSSLTAVVIPASITNVKNGAFEDCTSLATVYLYSVGTYFGYHVFYNNAAGRKIYVISASNSGFTDDQRAQEYPENPFVEIPSDITGVKAHQNPEATDDYWFTFYHPLANVNLSQGGKFDVEIYKATLNGTNSLTLTKIEGDKVKAGNAVLVRIVKATSKNWDPDWDVTIGLETENFEGDYSGNDLKGGSTVTAGYEAYTLSSDGTKMGFYKFTGAALDANKAHLELPTSSPSSPARQFIGWSNDNTTGIASQTVTDHQDGEIFDLTGRRVQNPVRGIYMRDGQKFIAK